MSTRLQPYQNETKGQRLLIPKENGERGFIVVDEPNTIPFDIAETPTYQVLPAESTQQTSIRTSAHVTGSYSDRARAFNISTTNLAIVTGIGFIIAGAVLRDNPLTLAAVTIWFFSGFSIVWFLSFLAHTIISPEGTDFFSMVMAHGHIKRAEKARLERYRKATDRWE